ncbi:transposase [Escherichia coli]|uniref:Transposase n=1 Tax=Escherichia coli TaxID=562 RepID=A0A376L2Q0_ECOLX|nr:transposase [Escherichia coli]
MSDNLLNKLTQLKLPAMAGSLIRQRETPQTYDELSFEERLTLLVDDELLSREKQSCGTVEKKCLPEISGNTGRAALSGLKRSAG